MTEPTAAAALRRALAAQDDPHIHWANRRLALDLLATAATPLSRGARALIREAPPGGTTHLADALALLERDAADHDRSMRAKSDG